MKRLGWQAASGWTIRHSGLFDLGWYAAQLEGRPPGASVAVAHYVLRGRAAGLSPSPLFEPSWYAPKDWRTRHADPLAGYLRRGAAATAGPHPLFEPASWIADHPEAARHPGGPLGHFLSAAGPDTPLPVDAAAVAPLVTSEPGSQLGSQPGSQPGPHRGAEPVTWGRARRALDEALAGWRADERRRRAPRVSTDLDHDAARRLADRCATAPLPDPGTGPDGEPLPLVSVVVPVKDRPEQVRDAVASVVAQTLTAWELIVVDDGSAEPTRRALAELAAGDPRIVVVTSRADGSNAGVCAARNAGAARARGRYVAWLDSDNRWTPHFLRTMVVTLAAGGWRVGYAAAEIVAATGTRYRAFDPGDDPAQVLALLEVANHVDLNVLVADRELLADVGGFDETLRRTVDYDLVWRLAVREVPRYVGVVGVVYDADHEAADRITVRERASWREVVKNRRLIDWRKLATEAGRRVAGRLSVVVVAGDGWAAAWVSATSVLRASAPGDDVEVLVVDDGGRRADAVLLATLPLLDARVRVLRTPVRTGVPLAGNLALAASTGATVVLLQAGVEVWPGWSSALIDALGDPGVGSAAPLVLRTDGRLAGPWAAGLHVEDARRAGERVDVPVSGDQVLAARAADLIAVGGADPLFVVEGAVVDLARRLPGRTVVATEAVTSHATRLRPGVALAQVRPPVAVPPEVIERDRELLAQRRGGAGPGEVRPGEAVPGEVRPGEAVPGEVRPGEAVPGEVRPGEAVPGGPAVVGSPGLRWVIKTSLPVGPDAVRWGDLHFARALAAALERLGQQVVIDHRPAIGLSGAVPEDVVLVLRGLEAAPARPAPTPRDGGAVRLMWVISHPQDVTDEELRGQDRVFAASTVWAARAGERAGVRVLPLLQCTDPQRFSPAAAPPDSGDPVLFVGNSRNVFRPVVRDLLAAGVDVAIYGDKWDRFLGPDRVRGRFVPNERLAAAYAAAGVVLNDHWDDMREQGFYSNRLFDAAAGGARIVSDHIDGLEELFGGLARTFTDAAGLVALVRAVPEGFPDGARRQELAERVAAEHSFDARARTLLDEALRLRG